MLRFALFCENMGIVIDQLTHGGCENFTTIIINLCKLRNIHLYLVFISFFVKGARELTSACTSEVSAVAVHCRLVHKAMLEGIHEAHRFV